MRYSVIFTSTALIASTLAAYVPSEPWTTLTPTGSAPAGATTDHTHKFGIQVKTVESSVAISSTVAETDSAVTAAASASGAAKRDDVVNQIGDGQIQQQTSQSPTTATVASQINDGQVQQQTDSAKSSSDSDSSVPQSCVGTNSLGMQLNGSVLTDEKGRIGAIVSNRQFQFDGPPPQAGSIYAAGWSVTENGLLALGDQTIFYQCHSGDFYNLYDESIAEQCSAVHLSIVDLVEC